MRVAFTVNQTPIDQSAWKHPTVKQVETNNIIDHPLQSSMKVTASISNPAMNQ
jgi:hypothetical protein